MLPWCVHDVATTCVDWQCISMYWSWIHRLCSFVPQQHCCRPCAHKYIHHGDLFYATIMMPFGGGRLLIQRLPRRYDRGQPVALSNSFQLIIQQVWNYTCICRRLQVFGYVKHSADQIVNCFLLRSQAMLCLPAFVCIQASCFQWCNFLCIHMRTHWDKVSKVQQSRVYNAALQ